MGQSLSQEVENDTNLLKVERRLRDKLECTKAKLYIDALNDECVAIVCAVAKFDGMLYIKDGEKKAEAENKDAKDEITNIIRRYLDMEGDNPDEKSDKKLIELVTNEVKALLSSKQETQESHHYHVVYSNKGFIRFDYFIGLQFLPDGEATGGEVTDGGPTRSGGVKKAALSYYGQVGLMNATNAKPQVLMYELRRATEDKNLVKAGKELVKLTNISSVVDVGKFLKDLNQNDDPQPSPEPRNPSHEAIE